MDKKPFILGINGSPKPNGYVGGLLGNALASAKKYGAQTEVVNLASLKILPHSGRLDEDTKNHKIKDDMLKLRNTLLKADGIIFATPTHWFNVSSLMKLFLDRLTDLEETGFLLEGKVVGVISYAPQGGGWSSASYLMSVLNQMGMVVPPYGYIFDEGRKETWVKKDVTLLAKNIVQQINAGKILNLNWDYSGSKYKTSPTEILKK